MIVVKNVEYDTTVAALASPIDGDQLTEDQVKIQLDQGRGMQLAMRVYRNIEAKLGVESDHEKSAIFRHVMRTGFNKTSQCASTYLYNIRNGMYASNKRWNKKARDQARELREAETAASTNVTNDVPAPEPAPAQEPQAVSEPVITTPVPEQDDKRWGVWDNIKGELIQTFATRSGAQTFNNDCKKEGQDTKLWDRKKEQASA